jgi:hypothetical protein
MHPSRVGLGTPGSIGSTAGDRLDDASRKHFYQTPGHASDYPKGLFFNIAFALNESLVLTPRYSLQTYARNFFRRKEVTV